jgi:hypothetical protein
VAQAVPAVLLALWEPLVVLRQHPKEVMVAWVALVPRLAVPLEWQLIQL